MDTSQSYDSMESETKRAITFFSKISKGNSINCDTKKGQFFLTQFKLGLLTQHDLNKVFLKMDLI